MQKFSLEELQEIESKFKNEVVSILCSDQNISGISVLKIMKLFKDNLVTEKYEI